MNRLTASWLGCLGVFTVVLAGCQRDQPNRRPTAEIGNVQYRVSGPYAHQNLTVFLLHTDKQDDREFITLDQGLKDKSVTVSEKKQEQVEELVVSNDSALPLFLQEGDRLQGGKQDRILYSSLVIPPKTKDMAIPTFCCEQSRWQAGATGAFFEGTHNAAQAPKEVRIAGKVAKNQALVWDKVQSAKSEASGMMIAGFSNSSLNETLDAPAVKKISDDFANALSSVLQNHSDAVGVVIAINGTIEEVNVYPNHQLLSKQYPRLIQSYALDATLRKNDAANAKVCMAGDVAEFLVAGKEKSVRDEKLNGDNRLKVCEYAGKAACTTDFQNQPVHVQFLNTEGRDSAVPALPAPRQGVPTGLPPNPAPQAPQPPNSP